MANSQSDLASPQTGLNNLAGAATSSRYLRGNGTNVAISAIQAANVPTLNQSTPSGTAAGLSATLAVASGGTGQDLGGGQGRPRRDGSRAVRVKARPRLPRMHLQLLPGAESPRRDPAPSRPVS